MKQSAIDNMETAIDSVRTVLLSIRSLNMMVSSFSEKNINSDEVVMPIIRLMEGELCIALSAMRLSADQIKQIQEVEHEHHSM